MKLLKAIWKAIRRALFPLYARSCEMAEAAERDIQRAEYVLGDGHDFDGEDFVAPCGRAVQGGKG